MVTLGHCRHDNGLCHLLLFLSFSFIRCLGLNGSSKKSATTNSCKKSTADGGTKIAELAPLPPPPPPSSTAGSTVPTRQLIGIKEIKAKQRVSGLVKYKELPIVHVQYV